MRHRIIPLLLCKDVVGADGKAKGKDPVQSGYQLPDFEPLPDDRINSHMDHGGNLGTLVGGRTNLVVVDVDNADEAKDFLDFYKEELEAAPCALTPRGGKHFYFLRPVPIEQFVPSNTKKAQPGIDFLADHGAAGHCRYTVIPPSKIRGNAYTWADDRNTIFNSEPPTMSESMFMALTTIKDMAGTSTGRTIMGSGTNPLDDDGEISEGTRNDTVARAVSAAIIRTGSTNEMILLDTIAPVLERCSPPMPDSEVMTIISSMCKKDRREHPERIERPSVSPGELARANFVPPSPLDLGDGDDFAAIVTAAIVGDAVPFDSVPSSVPATSATDTERIFWQEYLPYYGQPRPDVKELPECANWCIANVYKDGLILLEDTYYARDVRHQTWRGVTRNAITSGLLKAFPTAKKSWLENMEYLIKNRVWGPHQDFPFWWMDGVSTRPPCGYPTDARSVISFPNGLLSVSDPGNFHLLPHEPRYVALSQMPFDYDATARCPRWIQFLRELWDSETSDRARALQVWFGYCLIPDTSQHRMCVLHGPRRAGKSLCAKMLHSLVGRINTEATNLATLTSAHGMATLVGKLLAIMYDAHLPTGHSSAPVIEMLKSLSAGDPQPINRKYFDQYTANLTARILMVCNEIPKMEDAGSALAARMLPIRCDRSWYGREDTTLETKLIRELPGICNWALDGLRHYLRERRLIMPDTGIEDLALWKRATNLIVAWADDCVTVDEVDTKAPDFCETSHSLFSSWLQWCARNNVRATGTQARFEDKLRSVSSHIRMERRGTQNYFIGIRLTKTEAPHPTH